jgi:regulator of replication initiation timing
MFSKSKNMGFKRFISIFLALAIFMGILGGKFFVHQASAMHWKYTTRSFVGTDDERGVELTFIKDSATSKGFALYTFRVIDSELIPEIFDLRIDFSDIDPERSGGRSQLTAIERGCELDFPSKVRRLILPDSIVRIENPDSFCELAIRLTNATISPELGAIKDHFKAPDSPEEASCRGCNDLAERLVAFEHRALLDQQHIAELNQKNCDLRSQVAGLLRQMAIYGRQIADLHDCFASQASELSSLKGRSAQLEDQSRRLEAENEHLRRRVAELEEQSRRLGADNGDLRRQVAKLENQSRRLEAENRRLAAEFAQLPQHQSSALPPSSVCSGKTTLSDSAIFTSSKGSSGA